MTGTKRSDCLAWSVPAGGSDSIPHDVRMPGSAGTRNMERLILGTAAWWRGARRSPRRGRHATMRRAGAVVTIPAARGIVCGLALALPPRFGNTEPRERLGQTAAGSPEGGRLGGSRANQKHYIT